MDAFMMISTFSNALTMHTVLAVVTTTDSPEATP